MRTSHTTSRTSARPSATTGGAGPRTRDGTSVDGVQAQQDAGRVAARPATPDPLDDGWTDLQPLGVEADSAATRGPSGMAAAPPAVPRRTTRPRRSRACSTSAVLPTPASPATRSRPPRRRRAPVSARRTVASSRSRPTSLEDRILGQKVSEAAPDASSSTTCAALTIDAPSTRSSAVIARWLRARAAGPDPTAGGNELGHDVRKRRERIGHDAVGAPLYGEPGPFDRQKHDRVLIGGRGDVRHDEGEGRALRVIRSVPSR